MSRSEEVLVALRRIIRATDQNSKRLKRQAGLTIPQTVLMRAIAANPGATLGDLTEMISLSPATVSVIVDRLEERKLVRRQRNQRDKRIVNVSLTDDGKELLENAPAPLQDVFIRHFDNLSAPQQGAIISSLQALASLFGATDIDASPILTLGNIPEQWPGGRMPYIPQGEEPMAINLREPIPEDAVGLNHLVRISPPLDQNSLYCNLLQCSHFSRTSIVAEQQGKLVGFVTGYLIPERPETLFVWQVGVHPDARRHLLGQAMLEQLLARLVPHGVRYLETTITEENQASEKLFQRLAARLAAGVSRHCLFEQETHFRGQHASEWLVKIGPFEAGSLTVSQPTFNRH